MEELAGSGPTLVGSHDRQRLLQEAVVDDPVEDVGGVRSVGLLAELVDHEDLGMDERLEGLFDPAFGSGPGEGAGQLVGSGEAPA